MSTVSEDKVLLARAEETGLGKRFRAGESSRQGGTATLTVRPSRCYLGKSTTEPYISGSEIVRKVVCFPLRRQREPTSRKGSVRDWVMFCLVSRSHRLRLAYRRSHADSRDGQVVRPFPVAHEFWVIPLASGEWMACASGGRNEEWESEVVTFWVLRA